MHSGVSSREQDLVHERKEFDQQYNTIHVLHSNVRITEKVKQGGRKHATFGKTENLSHGVERVRGGDTEHISI